MTGDTCGPATDRLGSWTSHASREETWCYKTVYLELGPMPAKDKDVGIPSPSFAHTTSLSRILAGLDRLFYWPLHLKLYFIKLTEFTVYTILWEEALYY